VVFRSATEPFDTSTPMGRMLVQMLGMFAQFERDTIIDRVINEPRLPHPLAAHRRSNSTHEKGPEQRKPASQGHEGKCSCND
jgi:hypothetical protein